MKCFGLDAPKGANYLEIESGINGRISLCIPCVFILFPKHLSRSAGERMELQFDTNFMLLLSPSSGGLSG